MPYKDPQKRREYNREYQRKYYHQNKELMRSRVKARKQEIKRKWDEYKSQVSCAVCGFNDDPEAIDFHHLDPTQKVANISHLVSDGYGWDTIMEEVAKCEPLCANHHRMKTAKEQGRRELL